MADVAPEPAPDSKTNAATDPPLRITLIGADGQLRADLDGQGLLGAAAPSFIACTELTGVQLDWPQRSAGIAPPRFLRLYFAGVSTVDTWNSWLRAPQLPKAPAFRLNDDTESVSEQRYQVALSTTGLPLRDGTLIELALPELPAADATSVRIRFASGPWLLQRIELASELFAGEPLIAGEVPDLPGYPRSQTQLAAAADPLAEQLAALAGDTPTVRDVWRLALPFRGGALLGVVEGTIASQLWDGGLVWPEPSGAYSRTWLRIGLPAAAGTLITAAQSLQGGYLPIANSQLQVQSSGGLVTLSQTAFVDLQGALRLRVHAQGPAEPPLLQCHAARAGRIKSLNQPRAQASIYEPLPASLTADELRIASHTVAVSQSEPAAGGCQLDLRIPLPVGANSSATAAPESFDQALAKVRAEADQFLADGAQLDLPDPHLQNAWRALLLHNRLFQRAGILRYGLFPGVYDGGLFGVEEGWNIVALAQYGHLRLAQALLERTFFDAEFLKKEGQHHQYRSGLCITYARDVHALTQDEAALRALWPRIRENAEWISAAFQSTQVLDENGQRPVHYGLLPKHTYGGDLTEPTYSLYGSSAAWRGLRDAALLAYDLGEDRADLWAAAAAATRENLLVAAERIEKRDATPPFLPFRTDEPGDSPSAGDYHQLFASLILETALFGWNGRWARSITEYLHATGRQTLGVARFDQWFGRLGIDAEYSRGTQLCALRRREFDRFHLGLLGQIGLSCDPYTFVSPETAIVLFSQQEYKERMRALAEQPARCDSDPCSAGTAVMLQYLRYLLAVEEHDEDDLPTGALWIGASAPRSFFAAGQSFGARGLPTSLGPISLRCSSTASTVTYELKTRRPLPVELFYFDAAGRRCSRKTQASGTATFILPR